MSWQLLTIETVGPPTVATAHPGMTEPEADRLRGEFGELVKKTVGPLVLDLRPALVLNGLSVSAIVRLWKQLRERNRSLTACVNPEVRQVFQLLRLDRIVRCFDTPEEALAALSRSVAR